MCGRRSRRVIQLGDKVTVQVYRVDTFKKQVDYQLVKGVVQTREPIRQPDRFQQRPPTRGGRSRMPATSRNVIPSSHKKFSAPKRAGGGRRKNR